MQVTERGAIPSWYLEGFVDVGRSSWRTVIHSLPLSIGRSSAANLRLRSRKISKRHAEIYFDKGLRVRDLGSTNGTFVNGRRVRTTRRLAAGDVIRFGDLQLRLGYYEAPQSTDTKTLSTDDLAEFVGEQSVDFLKLLETRAIRPLFQPVIDMETVEVFGYELLCRGDLEGFETSPAELFYIAERLERDVELSVLCRQLGMAKASSLGERPLLFVNSHPSELKDIDGFLESLSRLSHASPGVRLVAEIHEAAMTDIETMKELRAALSEQDIGLAFDDFGTGQSRLQALADVAPDYLKFDLSFVRDLHRVSDRRRTLVRRLIRMGRSLGIEPIAEGVETPEELKACLDVGFRYGQGYVIAEPLSPRSIAAFHRRLAAGRVLQSIR